MNLFLRYFILLFLSVNSFSQNIWDFSQNKNKIVIPFQLINNSIIIQPKINDVQLNLILDTGSGYNILFAFPEKDSIAFNNTSKIKITGPGMDEPIDAYLSKNNKIRKGKVLFYPLPWAAYLPLFAFVKKAIAMPPKTAPAIADAPNTPSAAKYGVPEPVDGFAAALSTFAFASFSVSSSVLAPVSPPSPTLPIY